MKMSPWLALARDICSPQLTDTPLALPSDRALLADAKAHDRAVLREAHARKLAPLGADCVCDVCSDVEGV